MNHRFSNVFQREIARYSNVIQTQFRREFLVFSRGVSLKSRLRLVSSKIMYILVPDLGTKINQYSNSTLFHSWLHCYIVLHHSPVILLSYCETKYALYSLLLNNHQSKNLYWSFKKIREMAITQ